MSNLLAVIRHHLWDILCYLRTFQSSDESTNYFQIWNTTSFSCSLLISAVSISQASWLSPAQGKPASVQSFWSFDTIITLPSIFTLETKVFPRYVSPPEDSLSSAASVCSRQGSPVQLVGKETDGCGSKSYADCSYDCSYEDNPW